MVLKRNLETHGVELMYNAVSESQKESKGCNTRNIFPEWMIDVYLQTQDFPEIPRKIPKNTHQIAKDTYGLFDG